MQDKIIIGILGIVDDEVITKLQNTYTKAIESSGGIPLLLPYVENDESIDTFVKICDGFLFTGGADIEPSRYGEEKKDTCGNIHPYRDELEFKAFEKIYPTGKPIMAICRGAQFVLSFCPSSPRDTTSTGTEGWTAQGRAPAVLQAQ